MKVVDEKLKTGKGIKQQQTLPTEKKKK